MDLVEETTKGDYPDIRILLDIIEALEELRIMGLKFDCRLGTVDADTLSLYVHIKGVTAESISRHINYRFDARKELELLAFDIQKMLCIERSAQSSKLP